MDRNGPPTRPPSLPPSVHNSTITTTKSNYPSSSTSSFMGRGGGGGVSDDEALRAILTSAQKRDEERGAVGSKTTTYRKRGRDGDYRQDTNRTNHHRPSRENHHQQQQQSLRENNSYYGPSSHRDDGDEEQRRRRQQRRPSPQGPSKIEPDDDDETKGTKVDKDTINEEKKQPTYKPNFGLSGALAKDSGASGGSGGGGSRVYKGIVLKFQEPLEARAPNTQWRFYVFKDKELLETLHISKQSAYLCGRQQEICDIYMAHPSLSSQHAVLQYRALPNAEGRISCQPYIMDLESTNGTFLNGVRIDSARYYQMKKGDVLTFGGSKREYVLLTQNTTALS